MSSKYDRVVSWARSHGAIIPESLSFPPEPHGRCITTSAIPKGTQVFRIPHGILITPTRASATLPALENSSVHEQLCAFIALERRKKSSLWREYFDSLPDEFTTPPYFTDDELEGLKGTNLFYAWKDRVKAWEEELEHVNTLIPELKWEEYLWAATVLSSRSFPSRLVSPTPDHEDPTMSEPILVPIMDMLNHCPNHPVTWLTSNNTIGYLAEIEYSPNDEIFNNYGYGFALEQNPHDSISLRLPDNPSLYYITRSTPLPADLVSKFRQQGLVSLREALTPFESKRAAYEAYSNLVHALSLKMVELAGDIIVPSEAGRYAAIYRTSQRDLYLLAYEAAKMEMEKIKASTRLILPKVTVPRQNVKRRKTDMDFHQSAVQWLCRQLDGDETSKEELATEDSEVKQYLNRLNKGFFDRINWLEWDVLVDDEEIYRDVRSMYKKFKKAGMGVSLETVRTAREMWFEEGLEIHVYPDAKEMFERLGNDKDNLLNALLGYGNNEDDVKYGMFMEEIPHVDRMWFVQDIMDVLAETPL